MHGALAFKRLETNITIPTQSISTATKVSSLGPKSKSYRPLSRNGSEEGVVGEDRAWAPDAMHWRYSPTNRSGAIGDETAKYQPVLTLSTKKQQCRMK